MKEVENKTYNLIGKIAIGLYGQNIQITLDALKQILNDHGDNYSSESNLGIGQSVSAAYRAWEKVDPVIYHAIAHVFTGRDGVKAWEKQMSEVREDPRFYKELYIDSRRGTKKKKTKREY